MATADLAERVNAGSASLELAQQWRRFTRAGTLVAIITSPVVVVWFHNTRGWGLGWSILAAAGVVIAFRGLLDLLFHRVIPWPSLFGTDDVRLREEDIMS